MRRPRRSARTASWRRSRRAASGTLDHRADVYGLGAILFLLLTNDVPAADPARGAAPRRVAAAARRDLREGAGGTIPPIAIATAAALGRRRRAAIAPAWPVGAYREGVVERALRFGRTYRTAILLVARLHRHAGAAWLAGW